MRLLGYSFVCALIWVLHGMCLCGSVATDGEIRPSEKKLVRRN